jgi:hypothetical protein
MVFPRPLRLIAFMEKRSTSDTIVRMMPAAMEKE